MNIYPAIDLKDGKCVRLLRGEMDAATVFNDSPASQAKKFQDEGFNWLHIVDLNGAFAGEVVNGDAVKAILANISIPAQLGGGIRTLEQIEYWLDAGINRVILGTVALKDPEFVKQACKQFPKQIVVGIDAKAGMVAVNGWAEVSSVKATELAKKFENAGVAAIIYTDIARDGAMLGANIAETVALAKSVDIPIILSGGVSSIDDLREIKNHENKGIDGAIVGRALYDGAITASDILGL